MYIYEWDVETVDAHGDIEDHDHTASCDKHCVEAALDKTGRTRLVLVRDDFNKEGEQVDRHWAYVIDGKLPEYFEDAYQRRTCKVPRQYHRELAKAMRPPLITTGKDTFILTELDSLFK